MKESVYGVSTFKYLMLKEIAVCKLDLELLNLSYHKNRIKFKKSNDYSEIFKIREIIVLIRIAQKSKERRLKMLKKDLIWSEDG